MAEIIELNKIMNAAEIVHAQQMVKEVLIADDMLEYAVDIIAATHPDAEVIPEIGQYVQYGSGPRGLQSLIKLAKARALYLVVFMCRLRILKQSLNRYFAIDYYSIMKGKQKVSRPMNLSILYCKRLSKGNPYDTRTTSA